MLVKDAAAGIRTRFVKAFEQRVAAIFQPDVPQQEVGHGSFFRTLLGNGRQLFVVAHQYELVDGVMLLMTGTVLLVYLKSKEKVREAEQEKIKKWLAARVEQKKIKLIIE